jgi:hypothetical protein
MGGGGVWEVDGVSGCGNGKRDQFERGGADRAQGGGRCLWGCGLWGRKRDQFDRGGADRAWLGGGRFVGSGWGFGLRERQARPVRPRRRGPGAEWRAVCTGWGCGLWGRKRDQFDRGRADRAWQWVAGGVWEPDGVSGSGNGKRDQFDRGG